MKRFLLFILLLYLVPAMALGPERIVLSAPDSRADGSPLAPAELNAYEIGCATHPAGPYDEWTVTLAEGADGVPPTRYDNADPSPGVGWWYCTAVAVDDAGHRSALSAPASNVPPNAPGVFVICNSCTLNLP